YGVSRPPAHGVRVCPRASADGRFATPMFIGHFAVAFAAKRVEASVSLATYFAAAQSPDILSPYFRLAGFEHVTIAPGDTAFTPLRFDSYPTSHSLLTVIAW